MSYKVILLLCASFILTEGVDPCTASDNCDFLIDVDVDLYCWPPIPPPPDEFVYNDGNAFWLTWGGTYRGTWFNQEDFHPHILTCYVEGVEFWFYHHPAYPWDVSDFYAELWNGDNIAPLVLLDEQVMTAYHYAPVQVSYSPSICVETGFWILEDTDMSSGGWPSLLGDIGPNYTGQPRSYVSEDFFIWEPWIGGEACSNLVSFEHITWGSIKSTFQ